MTRREQVFALAAEGKNNPQIAAQLGISLSTVRYYREPRRRKTGMRAMLLYLYKRAKAEDAEREAKAGHTLTE